MLQPLRTKTVGSVHAIQLRDGRFAVLGSNKTYETLEIIEKTFSRSAKFTDHLYANIIEIDGGYKANLAENEEITVYSFKGVETPLIGEFIRTEQNIELTEDFWEYLDSTFEELLVVIHQPNASEYAMGLTKSSHGMHQSLLLNSEG